MYMYFPLLGLVYMYIHVYTYMYIYIHTSIHTIYRHFMYCICPWRYVSLTSSSSLSLSLPLLCSPFGVQAGEKHFHPSCSHCCKCSLHFNEGEDICMAGDDVWHLDCDIARAERGLHTGIPSFSSLFFLPHSPFHLI